MNTIQQVDEAIASLLDEPFDVRERIATKLREVALAIGERDRSLNIIQYGRRVPPGASL